MQYLGVRGHPVRVGCRKMQSERGCREKQDWKGCIQSYVKARISKMGVLPTFGGNAFRDGWSEITLERPRGASAVSTTATPLTQELQRMRKVHQHSQPDPALLTSNRSPRHLLKWQVRSERERWVEEPCRILYMWSTAISTLLSHSLLQQIHTWWFLLNLLKTHWCSKI